MRIKKKKKKKEEGIYVLEEILWSPVFKDTKKNEKGKGKKIKK